jgi:hypothetical protein
MNKRTFFILLLIISSTAQIGYSMATEQIGPDTEHPTVAQPDWPKGIVEIPRHESRVYSIWVNGNENFYFKATADEINEMLALFAKARMRDHIVQIRAGQGKTKTFKGMEIEYNVSLQIVAGIALFMTREEKRENLPLEPQLTILTGNDGLILNQLKWPENVIIQSEIQGLSIESKKSRPKRDDFYGKLEFEDGSPSTEFVQGIKSRITLWEKDVEDGINIASVNNKGYFTILLSDDELASLKKGGMWLTVTISNFLTEAKKTDQRFPVEMLTQDINEAKPVKVKGPDYYYGRILFEDGSPAVLDPPPWPGAEIFVDFPFAGMAHIDSEGYFKVYLTNEQFEKASADKPRRNIYIPDSVEQSRSTAQIAYPVNLLSQEKEKAGVVKIPRPKPPKQELTKAESKIGKSVPGFENIRFETFQQEQANNKPLLVCFWDMDQRPSRQSIQMLDKQKEALNKKNVIVIAVHSGTKQEKEVGEWLKENSISLISGTIKGDPYDTLLSWGARGLPWLILTNKEHIVIAENFSLDELNEKIKETENAK